MKKALHLALLTATILPFIVGCDEYEVKKKEPVQAAPKSKIVHHFEPVQRSQGGLAVDTATGQMCKTWDWTCQEPKEPLCTKKTLGVVPCRYEPNGRQMYGVSCDAIATMPTCQSIAQNE